MERDIIIKFLNRKANAEEKRQVLEWLEQPGAKKAFDELLKSEWEISLTREKDETDYKKLLHQIHIRTLGTKEKKQANTIFPWSKIFRIAASFALLVGCIFFIKNGFEYGKETNGLAENRIQRSTGVGEKLTLKLPDGSTIVLNGNSSISFSSTFGRVNRHVQLDGEAYFQIAKDSLKPFQVLTEGMVTTALGTAFNAFARDGLYSVALTEGRVAIEATDKTVELSPGQIVILDKRENLPAFNISTFNYIEIMGWKEGILDFDRVPLGSILDDLANWYDVKIKIEDGIDVNRRVIGTFRNKNLSDVLTGLGFSMGFEFTIDKNQVGIKKNSL